MTSKWNRGFKSSYLKAVLKVAIGVKGCQKCSAASDSDSSASVDDSSDKAPPKCHCHHWKARLNEDKIVDKVVDDKPEEDAVEVVDSEEP